VRTPDGLETPMVIGKPAPFVSAFVDAIDDALREHSILKFFQVDIIGMFRMTSSARYRKDGVGSSRPNWR